MSLIRPRPPLESDLFPVRFEMPARVSRHSVSISHTMLQRGPVRPRDAAGGGVTVELVLVFLCLSVECGARKGGHRLCPLKRDEVSRRGPRRHPLSLPKADQGHPW